MKKYTVKLNVPTVMWATLEIEAASEEAAIKQAFEANKAGTVEYEFAGFDSRDAELVAVEEED